MQSWLNKLPEEERMKISVWIEDYFYRALDYILKQVRVVSSSLTLLPLIASSGQL